MTARTTLRLVILSTAVIAGAALPAIHPLRAEPPSAVAAATLPFQDPHRPMTARIDDLLHRLTLAEKIALLHQFQPAIPRLGMPVFKTGSEALHGLAWTTDRDNNGAVVTATGTVFPQAIGLASTWDPALIHRVGAATGDEARGFHAINPRVWGLQLWAPVVNLLRDPRWGRNEEGYSEDARLTGAIATAYGQGLEGDDPVYLKTAPVLKHYLANNNEVHRDTTSSNLRPRVKKEYDELAFKLQLHAFQRVHLARGQSQTVRLTVPVSELGHWDVTRGRWVVESSTVDLMVGASSADIRQRATVRVRGEDIPPRRLDRETRAIDFDDHAGVDLVDETKEFGNAIGATDGDWLKFGDADLGRRTRSFSAEVASVAAGGTIEVRLDIPTGRLLGTAQVPATGDVYTYATVTAPLAAASDHHDVYLVFHGSFRISTFAVD